MTISRVLFCCAGLMGAAGVTLAAAAAHLAAGAAAESAAYLLLLHAPAVITIEIAADSGRVRHTLGRLAAFGFVIGAFLFAGDIGMRAFAGQRLFPSAAPIGGTLLILSWLTVTGAALLARER